ncbi:DUF4395 domain-containing protein [Pseudalkalibacillus berkeleyi]|uniref:DUF4395 domain-containing protein n=1 Tax=Pseudalkalibacillus berkeleyi TaxID=1069813 RepID=A0ABS9GX92_9BACL|nr:DUF4395 domain-containing protein [Pseudalkalibacillus berkeleyi]MCF6137402.1 DUF4395 domain-containing protein [Pseudalkalibacillus berkeleyi]
MNHLQTIPRPLVRTNQWFILLSVVASWVSGQVWILVIPFIVGLSSLVFNINPVMKVARLFLTDHPSRYVQEDKDQQQFNQWIATILLTIALISGFLGAMTIYFVSSIFVATASFIAILGFCIGCFIRYQWNQYRFKRSQ